MKVQEIVTLLDAKVYHGEEKLEREVHMACASDLMSDVLAFGKTSAVLLTGLMNPQVIRTAEMMDIACVIFVRGKKPGAEITNLAKELNIIILGTDKTMYRSAGILYAAGLYTSQSEEEAVV